MKNPILGKSNQVAIEGFLDKVNQEVKNNSTFINLLNFELDYITSNGGKITIENGELVGTLLNRREIARRLVVKPSIDNSTPSFSVESPKETYKCDNPESVFYNRIIKHSYQTTMEYFQGDGDKAKCIMRITAFQNAFISPELIHISNSLTEMVYQFEGNNNVSLIETIRPLQGYERRNAGDVFVKFGTDLREKATTSITKIGDYCLIDYLESVDGLKSQHYFIANSKSLDIDMVLKSKSFWKSIAFLDYDILLKGLIEPEQVYEKAMKEHSENRITGLLEPVLKYYI